MTWRDADQKGYLSSLWQLSRNDDRALDFHGGFIPAVAEGLILRHTKPSDWVWDCFAGSGTTGLVADHLGRRALLTDLTPVSERVLFGDARHVSIGGWGHHDSNEECYETPGPTYEIYNQTPWQFDLVIAHPPYHSIVRFSDNPDDLSNCRDVADFLSGFSAVCHNINHHLKPGGFLGLVMGDIWVTRKQAEITDDPYGYFPLGFECMKIAMGYIEDATLTATVIKNIEGNRHNAHRENLMKARLFKIGATVFSHEYIFSIRKG